MTIHRLDTRGFPRPKPVLKITEKTVDMEPSHILEVLEDYQTFERDVRVQCEKLGKAVLSVKDDDGKRKKIQIQF